MTFNFKKEYGQNFLVDEEAIDTFINAINPTPKDFVIEIGPGLGAITDELITKSGYVLNIEIDSEIVTKLKDKYSTVSNWSIIEKDVLSITNEELFEMFLNSKKKYSNVKIVGALPYNISKKIIAKFLELQYSKLNLPLPEIYFIIQKEVAEDYLANTPKCTFLSNYSSLYSEKKDILTIDKLCFEPTPKVDGKALSFKIRNEIDYERVYKFKKFIKHGFLNPRKILLNSLKSIGYTKEDFEKLNLSLNVRAAEINLETWDKLYRIKNE